MGYSVSYKLFHRVNEKVSFVINGLTINELVPTYANCSRNFNKPTMEIPNQMSNTCVAC